MTEMPGADGTLRYTNDEDLAHVDRGDWWPDDEEDLKEQVRSVLDSQDGVLWMARCDGSGLVPGFDTRAAVALFRGCPWSDDPNGCSWVVLMIKDDEVITVIEFPSQEKAVATFNDHVEQRDAAGDRYDYVYEPPQPRTAWPRTS